MNTLLFFFAFPVAVIIFSIVLEKLLKNPIIVASLIFAVFLILTFAVFGDNFLIATLAYTILSFVTALIIQIIAQITVIAGVDATGTEEGKNIMKVS